MPKKISVQALINAPIQKVWDYYNTPKHIIKWNNASPDWHSPKAENDLRVGGRFNYRMESVDETSGFDFTGTYDEIIEPQLIKYTLDDGRKVNVTINEENGQTNLEIVFDAESENSSELQRQGWQAILDNFKIYVESNI